MILRDSFLTRRKEMPTIKLYSINKLERKLQDTSWNGGGLSGDWMEANITCTTKYCVYNIKDTMKEIVCKLTYPTLPHYITMLHIMNGRVCIRYTK